MLRENETKTQKISKNCMLLIVFMMIGVLVRLPIGSMSGIDLTRYIDPDSFFYVRKALEFLDSPVQTWHILQNRANDNLMNVVFSSSDGKLPLGISALAAIVCKIMRFFSPDSILFYFSAFISVTPAIPAYMFVSRHMNRFGGLSAAFMMAIAPSYFMHTVYGIFDTDGAIMLLALSLVICHFELLLAKNKKEQVLFAILDCAVVICFFFVWHMYFFYVGVITFLTVLFAMFKLKYVRSHIGEHIVPFATTLLLVVITILFSKNRLIESFNALFSKTSNWPDPGKYIMELSKPSLLDGGLNNSFFLYPSGIINWLGAIPFVSTVIILLILLVVDIIAKKRTGKASIKVDNDIVILLIAWSAFMAPIAFLGIRYVQFLQLPLIIVFGYLIGAVFESYKHKEWIPPMFLKDLLLIASVAVLACSLILINVAFAIVCAIVLLIIGFFSKRTKEVIGMSILTLYLCVFLCPVVNEFYMTKNFAGFLSDDVVDATTYLEETAPDNAVLVSWWGAGYYYQYKTGLKTVADGGVFDGSYFFFLANAFLTDNPELSKGIARMLSGGSLDALPLAIELSGGEEKAADLLFDILPLSKADAEKVLISKYKFSDRDSKRLLTLTHPETECPIYFIITEQMIKQMPSITYFGFWNFESDYVFEGEYDVESDQYVFPDEVKNVLMVKAFLKEDLSDCFAEEYSNDSVTILKITD